MAAEFRQLGDYRLIQILGAGGMGEVYFAVSSTGDRVAIKVIRPQLFSDDNLRRRFATEIENLKRVYGSRVARLEDVDPLGEPAWLAVEYVPGATVNRYVEARGPLPTRLAAMAGAMLADGLARVHQAGVLHRDLKPQNVILGPDGPVLIDFGLAVLAEQDSRFTQTGMLIGTPAYMAPEQVRGERALSAAMDIYALGATLVFAVTGHDLYPAGGGVHSLLLRIVDPSVAPDLTGVPVELAPVLGEMLAHDPAARPALATVRSRLLQRTAAPPWSLAFTPDGASLAGGGNGGTVELWDVRTGQVTRRFTDSSSPTSILDLAFSPDGSKLVAGRFGGSDAPVWTVD